MIQYNHHAALVHTLWQRKKREKEQKLNSKNTASSSKNNTISSSTWYSFLKNQPTKKAQKNGGKKPGEATTVVPGIRITSRTLWTTTNKLEAGPAAKGRDNEGQMRRSHVPGMLNLVERTHSHILGTW